MTITCTRRIQFCAGHRVKNHESKCRNLHGHNYVVWITAKLDAGTDELGRVVDFSVLKQRIGGWIEDAWDHGFILWDQDDEAIAAVQAVNAQKMDLVPFNPTAENMAAYLLRVVCPRELSGCKGLTVIRVKVDETENCSAEVTLGELAKRILETEKNDD